MSLVSLVSLVSSMSLVSLLMLERLPHRIDPTALDSQAFTPFHNVSCEHGYITATTDGFLKICTLSTELVWGADWPVQKIPVRATPHSLALHPPTRTAALITSTVAA